MIPNVDFCVPAGDANYMVYFRRIAPYFVQGSDQIFDVTELLSN